MAIESLVRGLDGCATSVAPAGSRVGVDLTLVPDVAASIATFGASYLNRIYTARELFDCGGAPSRLAARFAVKEAVTKVLAPSDAPGWWLDIETLRLPSGACELRLHGAAAAAAAAADLRQWSVSLTHEGDYAAAVVMTTVHTVRFPQEAEA